MLLVHASMAVNEVRRAVSVETQAPHQPIMGLHVLPEDLSHMIHVTEAKRADSTNSGEAPRDSNELLIY